MSQLFFCLQPGVKWLWFVCHEPCSKTNILILYFRWGEGSSTSVLGSQTIIWLLSLSPSGVRRPEVTKCQHLVSPAWPTFFLNGHFFWRLDTVNSNTRSSNFTSIVSVGYHVTLVLQIAVKIIHGFTDLFCNLHKLSLFISFWEKI